MKQEYIIASALRAVVRTNRAVGETKSIDARFENIILSLRLGVVVKRRKTGLARDSPVNTAAQGRTAKGARAA